MQRFAEIGKKGVLALMCDSTNAERPGFTMSERTVGQYLIIFNAKNNRIIIATFASNVDRVQQIINTAYKLAKGGRGGTQYGKYHFNVASELGYLNIPDQHLDRDRSGEELSG